MSLSPIKSSPHTLKSSFLDFVASYLRDLRFPTWIGLSDILLENQYAWSDGVSPVLYTNWNTNEPNNVGGAVSTARVKPRAGSSAAHASRPLSPESVCLGTLCGHESQPPVDRQVERRRLPPESQLRLLPVEMSVSVLFRYTSQNFLLFKCKLNQTRS